MATEITSARSGENDGYYLNLDVLRLFAVAAIVWIHSVETHAFQACSIWCRFAVPAFTAISVWLLAWRHGGDPTGDLWAYAIRRAVRIYLLFLAWNGIYAATRLLEHSLLRGGDTIRWSLETFLLAGFSEQLWFLPFLAVVTILAAGLLNLPARVGLPAWFPAVLLPTVGIGLALWPCPIVMNLETHPATYWIILSWGAIPAAFMVFGTLPFNRSHPTEPNRLWLALLMIAMTGLFLQLSKGSDKFMTLLHNGTGVLLVVGAVLGPRAALTNDKLRKLGALALPIYLIHVLIVHAIQAAGHRFAHLPVSSAFDAAVFSSGLIGGGLVAWFLLKMPHFRWLVSVR